MHDFVGEIGFDFYADVLSSVDSEVQQGKAEKEAKSGEKRSRSAENESTPNKFKEAENKQLASKSGEMRKDASAEVKAPYEDQHRQEHAEFVEQQKAWEASPEFAELEKAETHEEKRKAAETE